jgi:hypothetical protein
MGIKLTTEGFIKKAKEVHGDKYDYSKSVYKSSSDKIEIICPKHGSFFQLKTKHVNIGRGCYKCNGGVKLSTEEFIKRAKEKHGDKYDYSKTVYGKNKNDKVLITCPIHGDFIQRPEAHINMRGCVKCGIENNSILRRYDNNIFEEKSRLKHGDKYDYSKVLYFNETTPVTIICPIHGEFHQIARNHYVGGCEKCRLDNNNIDKRFNNEQFIAKAMKVHGDKYDYIKTNYINSNNKIIITCVIHGDFIQRPDSHLYGSGCPSCNSSKGELKIHKYLRKNNIKYIPQHIFEDCKYIKTLKFDFFLPEYNTCIEYDGELHFISIDFFGGEENLNNTVNRDNIKNIYCKDKNIKLIRIAYTEYNNIENILEGILS